MNMNFAKFPVPVLDDETQKLYHELYGDYGENFINILDTSPNEIAVISRLIAYLEVKKGVTDHGYQENST